jgi:hypothetical protein
MASSIPLIFCAYWSVLIFPSGDRYEGSPRYPRLTWVRARLTPISYGPVTPVTLRLGIVLLTLTAALRWRCLPFFKDGLASPAAIEHN